MVLGALLAAEGVTVLEEVLVVLLVLEVLLVLLVLVEMGMLALAVQLALAVMVVHVVPAVLVVLVIMSAPKAADAGAVVGVRMPLRTLVGLVTRTLGGDAVRAPWGAKGKEKAWVVIPSPGSASSPCS